MQLRNLPVAGRKASKDHAVETALADHEKAFAAKRKLAFQLMASRYFGEAETALREAHDMCPSHINTIFALAVASCVTLQYREAAALCRLAVDQTGRTTVYKYIKRTKNCSMYSRIARGRATEDDHEEVKKEVLWFAAQTMGMPMTSVTNKPRFWETFLACPWTNACAESGRLDECLELNPLATAAKKVTSKYKPNPLDNFIPLDVRSGDAGRGRTPQSPVLNAPAANAIEVVLPGISATAFQPREEFVYRRSRKPKLREPLSHPSKMQSQLHTHLTYIRPNDYIVGVRQTPTMPAELAPLLVAAERWLALDKNPATRAAVEQAVAAKDASRLGAMFGKRMKFGTAGLRARMDAGTACMNSLTVIQATQGLLKYVKDRKGPQGSLLKVVVGYDARHNSKTWAQHVAAVVRAIGGVCYVFSSIVPTPLVPYGVTRHRADIGIMVTASHNPKADNGYKVYWSNGCQIVPPHDANIEKSIQENLEPWGDGVWDEAVTPDGVMAIDADGLKAEYLCNLEDLTSTATRCLNATAEPMFVYTPVHGVGTEMVQAAMRMAGLPAALIPASQECPDPEFPTTKFPNPEEKGVLDEAMRLAEAQGQRVILANDPDADRLAVAERQPDGRWKVFTGNELGALLGYYAWEQRDKAVNPKQCCMLASRVSSRFLGALGKKHGFNFEVTLTGFKWMGNRARELEADGKTILFAFEEAIGYMHGATGIFDKDGVSAAVAAASLAVNYRRQGTSLAALLRRLYDEYGWHITNNSYYICHDPAATAKMFARLRTWPGASVLNKNGKKYPGALGPTRVVDVEDIDVGAGSFMITFHFDNSATVTLRTSGTEPKIKYYSELVGKSEAGTTSELAVLIERVVAEWYQPSENGFIAPAPPKAKI